MNTYFKIGIAFAAGALAGTIAGILLAPDKGDRTREKLVKRAKGFEEDCKSMADNCRDTVKDWKEKIKHEAEKFATV